MCTSLGATLVRNDIAHEDDDDDGDIETETDTDTYASMDNRKNNDDDNNDDDDDDGGSSRYHHRHMTSTTPFLTTSRIMTLFGVGSKVRGGEIEWTERNMSLYESGGWGGGRKREKRDVH